MFGKRIRVGDRDDCSVDGIRKGPVTGTLSREFVGEFARNPWLLAGNLSGVGS